MVDDEKIQLRFSIHLGKFYPFITLWLEGVAPTLFDVWFQCCGYTIWPKCDKGIYQNIMKY
jgi:hypothetical protein